VRFFIHWHGLKHPRAMGVAEVEAFLTMLATERAVSSSTTTTRSAPCAAGRAGAEQPLTI
jgi:deoxyinosine 3'endonuclease (endonuclease V)